MEAITFFGRAPKLVTIATHVDLEDVTPIHCLTVKGEEMHFHVPRQKLNLHLSRKGVRFSALKVEHQETTFWLVVCESNRQGFLLPRHVLGPDGRLSKSRRLRPSRLYK